MVCCNFLIFFFFKQKTAYEMRISDWSSDVCSSDLRMPDPATVSAVLAIMDRIGELCQAVASGAPLSSLNDDILIEALSQCEVAVDGGTAETAILAAAPGSDIRRAAPVLRSIRLQLRLIDQPMNGVSDMVLARNDLRSEERRAG